MNDAIQMNHANIFMHSTLFFREWMNELHKYFTSINYCKRLFARIKFFVSSSSLQRVNCLRCYNCCSWCCYCKLWCNQGFFKIKFYSRISRFIDELKNCLAVCIYFFSPVWISFNNNIYRYPIELYSLYKYKLLVGLLILRLCSINVNYVQCHDNSVISI